MKAFFELGEIAYETEGISRKEKACIWTAGFMYRWLFNDESTILRKIVSGLNHLSPYQGKFKHLELTLLGIKRMQTGPTKRNMPLTPERASAFNWFMDVDDDTESGFGSGGLGCHNGFVKN